MLGLVPWLLDGLWFPESRLRLEVQDGEEITMSIARALYTPRQLLVAAAGREVSVDCGTRKQCKRCLGDFSANS